MKYKGMSYLKNKLKQKKLRNETRYRYYEMKNSIVEFSKMTPPGFEMLKETLGWCTKAVDSIADRLSFRTFENDTFDMNSIFSLNNQDVLIDNAILSALITSCSFIYISKGEDGFPRLQVIDGRNATGIIDPITNLLSEGYAVLETDVNDIPTIEAYFTKEETVFYEKGKEPYSIENDAPYPLLVPIIFRPDPKRPFGRSRITRACMRLQQTALRTLKRSEISAEFYSFPQKYALGTSPDSEPMDKYRATISSFLEFTKDEDGDKPVLGQFQQQTMTPYNDQLRMIASLFAGETGLTLDDLGISTENPSSVEAIKAQHENLRLTARKAQKVFGSCLLNVGYLASCVRDEYPYSRSAVYQTVAKWEPIFEPDGATLSSIGDGAIKINQAIPNYFDKETLRDLTGINYSETTSATTSNIDILTPEDEINV